MANKIYVELTPKSIDNAIKLLRQYNAWVQAKEKELRTRLAEIGVAVASVRFSGAKYDGNNDVTVTFSDIGDTATISAKGEAVAFIEFGSGAKLGYGHPDAAKHGFGPGTWSDGPEGKGHWNEMTKDGKYKGWWFGDDGKHTYGNPPAMAMHFATQEILANITRIATEVFKT